MKKRILLVPLALILAASLIACAAPAPEAAPAPAYSWKIAHIRPTGTDIDKDVTWLVDKIYEDSGGKIVIGIYPAASLGDYLVVQERVMLGDVEMQLACVGTLWDVRMGIQALPGVVATWDDARELYTTGSWLMDMMAAIFADQGLKLISGWPVYFGGIALAKEPPSPADPDVPKNIKIRVPPMKSFELYAEAMGYIATPIPFAELFTSLESGIVDGAIGAGAEGYYANVRDLIKYYLPLNDHFEMWYFYMNLDLWNSLSEEDQKILQDAGLSLEARRFAVAEEREKFNEQRLRDYGIEVITFTDAELARFSEKARDYVLPEMREDIGPAMDEVLGWLK